MKRSVLTLLLALLSLTGAHAAQTCLTGTIAASTPASRFADHGDGTVTDNATGLMWKKCSEGQSYNGATRGCDGTAATYSWQQALQKATAINAGGGFSGQSDWRLPNVKELSSIVEHQCAYPTINQEVFPATPSVWFWSSSPVASNSNYAWDVSFSEGNVTAFFKHTEYGVRLVRGGQ